ncbi:MAG: tetratricopeptide repeat protein, partial [Candidatus Omnitrophota bacterium]
RHYSSSGVSIREITNFCKEETLLLNRNFKKAEFDIGAIDGLKKTGQLLWDHLLSAAVKDRLKSTIIKDLVLSLDEDLINIPWELFYDGKDFLCLKFNIGRLIRTSQELRPLQYRSPAGPLKMLIIANPTGDLKSAYNEGLYIKNQFDRRPSEVRIDFKSTSIDTLYLKKNMRDYDILHFAGHCEYDAARPRQSGWVLADARFTAGDIMALSESASMPALVFSNACYSAGRTPDEIALDYHEKTYSIASAFLFSGTTHYIGAIRRIEDETSRLFAREFYAQLIKGETVGSCLRQARLQIIKEYGRGAAGWMSYILYGDPNLVLFKPRSRPEAPMLLLKKRVYHHRKRLSRLAIITGVILAVFLAWVLAPSINPDTYFLFARTQRFYARGDNESTIRSALRIIGREPTFLGVYPLLADAYQRVGMSEEALKIYFDYALYAQKKRDNKHMASSYISIGWCYQQSGDYEKALDFYSRALALSRKKRDKFNEAVALRKLAVWYIDNEKYDRALELLTKSSEINRERRRISAYSYNLACDYFDIGLVFANKDDLKAARDFYRKSQGIFEKMRFGRELSDCYFNLGEICLFDKEYHKAKEYYLKGLRIDEFHQNKPSIAADYNMLGELCFEMGDVKEAEEFFNKGVLLSRQINAQPELAESYENLGILYKAKRDMAKSREFSRKAREIYRRMNLPAD